MECFSAKKVLIVGFSVTGTGCAQYLSKYSNVYISEFGSRKEENADTIFQLEALNVRMEFGGHSEDFINGSEFAILSPSIPRDSGIIKRLEENNIPYFSDIEFTYRIIKDKQNPRMVLVTGTNGKTTTTLLMSHILSQKFNAPSCGNVGVTPMLYLDKNADYLVVEASSYQLNYSNTLAPKIAVFTNFTPDHISWHGTLDAYFEAKASVFKRMDKNSSAILNYDDEKVRALADSISAEVYYFALNKPDDIRNFAYISNDVIYYEEEKIIDTKDVPIVGSHNLQNAMCCIIAAKIEGLETSVIADAITTFTAPAHRCELVRMLDGTAYYNDSKATNPEAAIVAINSFEGKKVVLIAGGRDKNTSLEEFVKYVNERISKVVLIGEATKRFMQELYESGYTNIVHAHSLEEAIDLASLDKPDVVLLSPACASFDMFKSYEERGEAFRRYVLSKKQLVS